jgi:hypothetical protein
MRFNACIQVDTAARIRLMVSAMGAEVETVKPKRRAISLTLMGLDGIPPRSIALSKALAFLTSGVSRLKKDSIPMFEF